MDGSRRKIQRGEGSGSGRRSSNRSGDGAAVPWESHERSANFTQNEIKLAQQNIEQRRKEMEDTIKGLYHDSNEKATESYDAAIRLQEEQGLNPAGGRAIQEKLTKILEDNDKLMGYDIPQSRSVHRILDKLEYPVKDNEFGFTEQDREFLRGKTIDLLKVKMRYHRSMREKSDARQIPYLQMEYNADLSKEELNKYWLKSIAPEIRADVKALQEDFNKQRQAILQSEGFQKAMQRAESYIGAKMMGSNEKLSLKFFTNKRIDEPDFSSDSDSSSDEE